MEKQLLLISNSKAFGGGYLTHCGDTIVRFLRGRSVLFIPYALNDMDAYAETAKKRFRELGIELAPIHTMGDPVAAVEDAESIFVGGGNTFRLLGKIEEEGLIEVIAAKVRGGMPYIGASAGANIVCPTICTTNDMPIVEPACFSGLDLVTFQINPHYIDPDPNSRHMGETREARLKEFHEEWGIPVVGLREGSWLYVKGDDVRLEGASGARIFRRDTDPVEVKSNTSLNHLLERVPADTSQME